MRNSSAIVGNPRLKPFFYSSSFSLQFPSLERVSYVTVGNLRINFTNNNNLYTNNGINPAHSFRYIIISGGVAGERLAGLPPDYNDYYTVCKYYGIPE